MNQFNIKVSSCLWCRFINGFSQYSISSSYLIRDNNISWRTNIIFLFENWFLLFKIVLSVLGWQNSWTFNVWPVVKAKKHVFLKFVIKSESRPKFDWIPRSLLLLFFSIIKLLFWSVINLFFCFDSKPTIATECEAHIFRTWSTPLSVAIMGYRLFCPIAL